MKPVQLPKEIVSKLNERLNDEYVAHYFYRNASNYCENVGYTQGASYFKQESEHELVHALGLQKFMTDWNVQPTLLPVESPVAFSGLVDIIEKAYGIEYDLFSSYTDDSLEIFKQGHLATFNFLSGYVDIQNESLAQYSTLLNKLDLIDKENKNWLNDFQREELVF